MEKRPNFLGERPHNGEWILLDKEVNPTMDIRLWFVIQQIMAWIHTGTKEENQRLKDNLSYLITTIDQKSE